MTLAAGSARPPQSVDDLLRQWVGYQVVHVHTAPSTASKRYDALCRVWSDCSDCGLFTIDPDKVALHFYGGRAAGRERQRAMRTLATAIEDFREWFTMMQNRGQ
ncbi:MAG: hypothetical protein WCT23_09920 [Candidatus Neomarinimicrobiota bacterium]